MQTKLSLFVCIFILSIGCIKAQNYLINPSTDGGFEGYHGWTIVNHPSGENKWVIGGAEKTNGNYGAYVSDNSGSQSLTSPQSANNTIYIYKDVVVPANASSIALSFKFKNASVSDHPPRVYFAKTSLFEPTPRTNVIYTDIKTITKVLNNAENWELYTNSNPLVEDRQVTFTSKELEPGERYRIMIDWFALKQGSVRQTSPPSILPINPRLVTSSDTYTPGGTTRAEIVFDQDGQNYEVVWTVEGGAQIQSGQGSTRIVVFHPLGVSGEQTYRARILPVPRTPTFESTAVNSGPIALDEVALSFVGVPKITSLSTSKADLGTNVTINGEHFDPIAANNIVYLGGVKCQVISANETAITIVVPSQVGPSFFTVTNATTKLSAIAPIKFTPIHSALLNATYASHEFSKLSFENPLSFSTSFSSSFDKKFELLDLDLDGKLDVVSYASNGAPKLLKNTSTEGLIDSNSFLGVRNFTGISPTYTTNSSRSILFADFNHDGKLDVGTSNNVNNGGFINPNTSSVNTASLGDSKSLMASGNNYKVNGAFLPFDVNRDGKIDIFGISSEQGNIRPYFSKNKAVTGNFDFENIESSIGYDLTEAYGGDFGDFDGDGAHDVVYGANGFVVLLKNNTQEGTPFTTNFSLKRVALLPLPNMFGSNKTYTVRFLDVDGDDKLDIVATNFSVPYIHIWRNAGSGFNLEARQDIKIKDLRNTVGLAFGDLNGNGKVDFIISDYVNGVGSKISYIENQSTVGTLSFAESVTLIQSNDSYQQIELSDIDGDGKPDIIGANVSNSTLDVFRNRVFESGSIAEDQVICLGSTASEIQSVSPGQINSGDRLYSWQSSVTGATSGFTTIADEASANLIPGVLTQTTYFRRGIASSDDTDNIYYTTPIAIEVVPLPTILKADDVTICGTGSVPLVATTSAGDTSFVNWYDSATGGNLLGKTVSGEIFNSPAITQNTTFYAEAENANGCIAANREAVEATLNLAIPTVTLGSFENTKCDAANFTLSASTSSEAVIRWYDAETAGNLLRTGDTFTTPVINSNTTYWVEASNCNGASTRTPVALTLIQTPSIVSAPSITSCQFSDVQLTAQASAGVLNWYLDPTGGVPNDAYATITNLNANVTRYVSASITVNGVTCESPRTPVKVTMLAGPTITNAISNQTVYGDQAGSLPKTVRLWVTEPIGTTISWYADAAGTQLLLAGNRNYSVTAQKQSVTYYAIATSLETGCQSAPRAITVNYSGPKFDALANTFALTDQENVVIKATGLSRLATSTDYIWQRSDNGGASWTNLSASTDAGITYSGFAGRGGTTAVLTISKADAKIHGFQYRLKLIGTNNSDFVYTNPSILTIADVYGACDDGDLPVSDYTFSTAKTGLSVNGGGNFTSDKTKLTDGNLQTGLVVTNSESLPVTSSLSFDGAWQMVSVGKPTAIQNITSAVTVEAWIRPQSWAGYNNFNGDYTWQTDLWDSWYASPVVEKDGAFSLRIGKTEVVNQNYDIEYDPDYNGGEGAWIEWDPYCWCERESYYRNVIDRGVISFTVFGYESDNSWHNFTIKTDAGFYDENPINLNQWSHIAASYDIESETFKLYVNGVLVKQVQNQYDFVRIATGGDLALGRHPNNSFRRSFKGLIDEVRIWDLTKPQADINGFKSSDVTGTSGLAAYYKFMEGAGTTVADLTGNGATGILYENSQWSTTSDITDYKKVASIVADLGVASTVNGLRLSNLNGILDGGTPVQPDFTGGYLESSTDGVNWIRQINAIPSIPLNGQTLAINDVTARYFRFRKEDQTNGAYFGLAEMTFLGGGYETVPYIQSALPSEKYVLTGSNLELSAQATSISGASISSYQWSSSESPLDGTFTDLSDGGDISGTNTSNLIISNYTNGTPTYYRLTATQSNGCVVSTQTLVNLEATPYYPVAISTNTLEQLNSWTVNENGSVGSTPVAFSEGKFFILKNASGGTYELAGDWTNAGTLKLSGHSLSLSSFYNATIENIEDFNASAYVKTLGTGYLKSNVSNNPKVFPVGTDSNYAPVTITNNLGSDEVFSVAVSDGVTNPGTGISDYLDKTWKIRKTTNTTTGGTHLDLTFKWDPSDVVGSLGEPMVFWSTSATSSSWSNISSSYYASIERSSNSITLKGFKGVIRNADRYFIIKNAVPTITSFTPTRAGTDMEVVITGTGFTGATAVLFGGTNAASFTVSSSTQIKAVVGTGSNGNVTVTTPGGTVNKSYFYFKPAPTISSFTPTKTNVGQPIVISGTNFNNVSEVNIGGVSASVFNVNSSSEITVIVPQGVSSGTIQVTAEGGTAALSGFELGTPLANAASIVSWYPYNASTLPNPYMASTRKSGAVSKGELTYSGLTGENKTDRLKFRLPTVVGSILDIDTAPYISLKIQAESTIDLERIVLQGLQTNYGTKLQLRWSLDNFASSLGEFNGYSFNSTSSNFERVEVNSYWRYTSLSLASAPQILGGEEIELRIYAYGNSSTLAYFSIVKNNTNYATNDNSPAGFKDSSDAITIIGRSKNDPNLATVLPIEVLLSERSKPFSPPVSDSPGSIQTTITSGSSVAAYESNRINFLGMGKDTLTIKQAETDEFMPVTQYVPITVKDYPVIAFNNITAFLDDNPMNLTGQSPSEGSLSYQSSNLNVATISGNTLSIVGKGVAQITAQQASSGFYLGASANAVLLVKDAQKPEPSVTWVSTLTKLLDDQSFRIEKPQSNSSGSFTYYSSNPQVATISGREVTLVGNGISVLTAVQEETDSYNATKIITLLVVGDPYKTNASLSGLDHYTKLVTDADFDISGVTSLSSAPIIYMIADDQIADISDTTIRLKKNGNTTIYAYQQETGVHKATAISSILTVNLPPLPNIEYDNALALAIQDTIIPIAPLSTGGLVSDFSIWPPLPRGLTLNTQNGIISGAPLSLAPEATYQVTARNLAGTSQASFNLSVIDNPPLNLTYTSPQTLVKGEEITSLLPSSSGGSIVSYSVSPSLPLGLSLNEISGEISGMPLIVSEQQSYTIQAENSGGIVNFDLQITVIDAAPESLTYRTPVLLTKGIEMEAELPLQSTGGEISNFTVHGDDLPDGLSLHPNTGAISGTPTTAMGLTSFTIRGSNDSGFIDGTIQFIINDAPPSIRYNGPITITKGSLISPILPTNTGGDITSFSIRDSLPEGLEFNPTTGTISGTPTVITPLATYRITAENLFGNDHFDLDLTVVDVSPTNLNYNVSAISATKSESITPLSPTSEGGAIVSYHISPSLPNGISLNTITGEISGTPRELSNNQSYIITATNSGGTITTTLSLEVLEIPPSALAYSISSELVRGVTILPSLPSWNGGPIDSYSITPSLPTGIVLDPITGMISGTPQQVALTTTYTITASNSGGNATTLLSLKVNKTPLMVRVNDVEKIIQNVDPPFSVTYSGFVLNEDETVLDGSLLITREAGEAPGTYQLTPSGLTSSNYSITFVAGTLTIIVGDSDGDGVRDPSDNCPTTPNADQADADGDGVGDVCDNAPGISNPDQRDTDADGIGDVADPDDDNDGCPDTSDAFPLDPSECSDNDGDGTGDNADTDDDNDGVLDTIDNCVFTPNPTQSDIDADGIGDVCDTDIDGDGWTNEQEQACGSNPTDATDTLTDFDRDGLPDCSDPDDDNDGVADVNDAFPLDATEWVDTDADGTGNNADTDDDNDGQSDEEEIFCGTDPLDASSFSGDVDADGITDCRDTDNDNDGVNDVSDAFPLDPAEWTDTDADGIGNNADTDDDGDGYSDLDELECNSNPLDANELPADQDQDGIPDCKDTDLDGDGCLNTEDVFPRDPSECLDTDGDGLGDNVDVDDDGDGVIDLGDAFPLDPSETKDSDGDGIGDNADPDDNNDGFDDAKLQVSGVLTPNSSGLESTWKIINLDRYPNARVRVYNKNGQEVFSAKGYRNDWRGTYKNSADPLPAGSYYYVVQLNTGEEPIKGWLYITY